MPIVTIRTNKFMSRELKVKVSEEIKKVIDTIPYEKGEYVITDITDGASMLLGNVSAESPIATVEINIIEAVFKAVDREILEAALFAVTKIICTNCKILPERVYAIFRTVPLWAVSGVDVEKTIVKVN